MEYRNTESTYTNTFLKSQKTKLYHAEKTISEANTRK